ncbi:zinc finger protein 16-like isoform X2 [Protopterus annectens]|nr:zinc finger protein 16-like isoform X2 [Protopterus annectens]
MLLLKGHEEASHVNIRVEEAEQQKDNLQDISTICRYTESKENWIQHSSFGRNHVYHGAKQTSEVQKGCYPHFTSIQQKSLKEERNYETSKCDKSIPVKERVIPHQQIHKVPYKCADCNRSFYKKCNLVMHRRVHWGTKPLEYAECNKTTDQKKLCEGYQLGCVVSRYTESKDKQSQTPSLEENQLSQGQRRTRDLHFTRPQQQSHKEERSHESSQCDKSISVQEGLAALQIHKVPYKCADCNRSFYKKCNLVMHRRVHWGTKPHEGVESSKTIDHKQFFVGYQLSHVGVKPCAYDDCNTGFLFYNQFFIVKKQLE